MQVLVDNGMRAAVFQSQEKLAEQKQKEDELQRHALQQSQQSSLLTLQKQVQLQQEQFTAQLAGLQVASAKSAKKVNSAAGHGVVASQAAAHRAGRRCLLAARLLILHRLLRRPCMQRVLRAL